MDGVLGAGRDVLDGPGGVDLNGSDDRLEHPCRKCGAFVPSRAVRCHRCGTNVSTEEDSVEVILYELTDLLRDDEEDKGPGRSPDGGEIPPEKAPEEVDSESARPRQKVRYKKVKR